MANPEYLYDLLKLAVKRGARAPELMFYARELVDAVCANVVTESTEAQRAIYAADEIEAAASGLDAEIAKFLLILLGVSPGTYKRNICDRYELAGAVFGITGRWAREDRYAGRMLMYLAMELHQRITQR